MGEFAGYALDECDDVMERDEWTGDRPMRWKTCRKCGKEYLVWRYTAKGWRLFDANHIHVCPKGPEDV